MKKYCKNSSPARKEFFSLSEVDDHDYVETENVGMGPKSKQPADVSAHMELKVIQRAPASSNGRLKILLTILVLFLLGSLAALCALMILYLGNVASFHMLHEEYGNATAIMKVQQHEAAVEMRKCEMKDQRVHELLSETQDLKSRLDQVQASHERVSEQLNTSKVEMGKCEMKDQRVHELLSETQDLKSRLDQVQVSFERVSEQLNTSKERKCEMKFQQVHELLSEKQAICEQGWRSLGLKCYFFSHDKLNWMESRGSCVKKGADLVIITSKKEQDLLSSLAKETSWIGLNDRETEGKWMWVNKQTVEETGVTFWYHRTQGKSEPDNWKMEDPKGENCACLGHSIYNLDQWFDVSCLLKKKYICQK